MIKSCNCAYCRCVRFPFEETCLESVDIQTGLLIHEIMKDRRLKLNPKTKRWRLLK